MYGLNSMPNISSFSRTVALGLKLCPPSICTASHLSLTLPLSKRSFLEKTVLIPVRSAYFFCVDLHAPIKTGHHRKDENAPQLALTLALSRRERVIAGKGAVGANLRVRPVALPQGEGNLMGEVSAMPTLVPCRGGFQTRPSRW